MVKIMDSKNVNFPHIYQYEHDMHMQNYQNAVILEKKVLLLMIF